MLNSSFIYQFSYTMKVLWATILMSYCLSLFTLNFLAVMLSKSIRK